MSILTFVEKETIRRLFGIKDGYLFKYWFDQGSYNKNKTKEIILHACGINIYEDTEFKDLSQQKCVEKIWDEKDPATTANLIDALCEFFSFTMGSSFWSDEDQWDYQQAKTIVSRLRNMRNEIEVELPSSDDTPDIRLLAEDIESKIKQSQPELALDRLHTYSTKFIRDICTKNGISVFDDNHNHYPIDSMIARLRKYYESNQKCESEFSLLAIKLLTGLFSKFNDIRNNHSYSHPNPILEKNEAEYVVTTMLATLKFISSLEEKE